MQRNQFCSHLDHVDTMEFQQCSQHLLQSVVPTTMNTISWRGFCMATC